MPKTDCWNWGGYLRSDGYGEISIGTPPYRDRHLAHRYVYEGMVGPISEGMVLDHMCENRACVNPSHLQETSVSDNAMRSKSHNVYKTHCPKGHEYSEKNTYWQNDPRNGNRPARSCKTCRGMRVG